MLKVSNINKSFSAQQVLKDVSFHVEEGKSLAIFGKSGSGKTTILRIIAGLLKPESGKIIIKKNDCSQMPPYMRPVGFQFQSYALFPNLTVYQNIVYPIGNNTLESVDEIIQELNLNHLLHRKIGKLSGGEQQRVALGRALVRAIDTDGVLLLDEPVSALDEGLRENARIMIRELQKKFTLTTVFITHDSKDIIRMADEVAVLDNSSIIQQGTVKSISSNPGSENVAISFGYTYIGICQIKNKSAFFLGKEFPLINTNLENDNYYKCYVLNEAISLSKVNLKNSFSGLIENMTETKIFYHYTIKVDNHLITSDINKSENISFKVNENIYLTIDWNSVMFYKNIKS